jgi:hypothetical protein
MILKKGAHRFTNVHVLDEPGPGGGYHQYEIRNAGDEPVYATINVQKGPVQEAGKNGIFMEDLLRIVEHRLECFQSAAAPFACRENALALTKIQEALHWLDHRTRDRQERGVEGFNKK